MKAVTPEELLDMVLNNCNLKSEHITEDRIILMMNEYLSNIQNMEEEIINPFSFLESIIAEKDKIIEDQLNEVIHNKAFLELEATWRSLYFLVKNANTGEQIKIKVLNTTKDDLREDCEECAEFDQSALFKKIYEHEYGTLGGEPFCCIVCGYEFQNTGQDINFLRALSGIGAASHTVFIGAAGPEVFGFKNYESITIPRDLKKMFNSSEFIQWTTMREEEDMRYVVLAMPHFLAREPYSMRHNIPKHIKFNEHINGNDNSKLCWGNPAYLIADRIINAVTLYNWPCAIRGTENGGLIEGLPSYSFETTQGDITSKCPTEINITDRREKELSDLGFIPLCHAKGTDNAVIFSAQTLQKPLEYNEDEATANANISARLPYILAASRFAHYIKAIMRDKIGSFQTANDVEKFLTSWISQYILLNPETASQETKAEIPLSGAKIKVLADETNPGSYNAVILIKPHFQMEELTASIRLVANIPNEER